MPNFGVQEGTVTQKQMQKMFEQMARTASAQESVGEGLDVQASSPFAGASVAATLINQTANQGVNGFNKVAFAMHSVIKNRLDYQAIGRSLLVVDDITTGDITQYDLDTEEVEAVSLAGNGVPPQFSSHSTRVNVVTGLLGLVINTGYQDISTKRFPLFDRVKERVAIGMAKKEDNIILGSGGLLEIAASKSGNAPITGAGFNRFVAAEAIGQMGDRGLNLNAFVMSWTQYKELLKFSTNEADQVTVNKIIETGLIGGLFGIKLMISRLVAKDRVWAVTTPDKLGRLPERKAVEVKVFDDMVNFRYQTASNENVGFSILNVGGVQEIDLS